MCQQNIQVNDSELSLTASMKFATIISFVIYTCAFSTVHGHLYDTLHQVKQKLPSES